MLFLGMLFVLFLRQYRSWDRINVVNNFNILTIGLGETFGRNCLEISAKEEHYVDIGKKW